MRWEKREKCIWNLSENLKERDYLGRPRYEWEDIKTDFKDIRCYGVDWVQVT
jgi:hypothetical protein